MPNTRTTAALALSALVALAACEGAGEHQNADATQEDSVQSVTGPDTAGEMIQTAPPPVGTSDPTPPDANPSTTTPADPSSPGVSGGGAAGQSSPADSGTTGTRP